MTAELPDAIDCARLADEARSVSGQLAASRLRRVTGVYRPAGDAAARFAFRRDAEQRVLIEGEIEAPLEALCQRCLEWMPYVLKAGVAVVAVPDEPAAAGIDADDYVVAPAGRLALTEFVEDEILLGCPMIPAHDTPACRAADDASLKADRHRPFAGLADLINKQE